MAYTTIDDPSAYFQTTLYSGTGSTASVTNGGNSDLQPDWVWIKCRNVTRDHRLLDSTRGVQKEIVSNNSDDEYTESSGLTAFQSDGFQHGGANGYGASGENYASFQWKANGGTTTSNGASGDIKASVTQREDTAKFSICTYTGTGINSGQSHRVNHGLGTKPALMLFKNRGANSTDWVVYHHKNTSSPETDYLVLNSTAATVDNVDKFADTEPNNSYATIGGDDNISSGDMVLYSFAEVQGYSKFGFYTGNGNADGPFVYTGFKPAFVIIKTSTRSAGGEWVMLTGKIATGTNSNPLTDAIYAQSNGAETGVFTTDFLSNGFKLRHTSGATSTSGETYTYIAFAESPFVSSEGVPTTAR
jgi:hypothetical protein